MSEFNDVLQSEMAKFKIILTEKQLWQFNVPIYEDALSKINGSLPCTFNAALIPATSPCAAASSYPELPLN
mgnify:CR=1 FL=1